MIHLPSASTRNQTDPGRPFGILTSRQKPPAGFFTVRSLSSVDKKHSGVQGEMARVSLENGIFSPKRFRPCSRTLIT